MPSKLYGNPIIVDISTDQNTSYSAGAVIEVGNALGCYVAPGDIAASTPKAGVEAGGGVYSGVSLENNANGAHVYWDGTSKFTNVANNNPYFGQIVGGGGGGANTTVEVLHIRPGAP